MGGGEDDDDGAMAHFRTDYKILPTSNLPKEASKPFQRGLGTFQRGLDPKGFGRFLLVKYDVQRCLEHLGTYQERFTKKVWKSSLGVGVEPYQ